MAHVSYHWVAGEATAQQLPSDSSSPAVLRSPAKHSILNVVPKSKYFLVLCKNGPLSLKVCCAGDCAYLQNKSAWLCLAFIPPDAGWFGINPAEMQLTWLMVKWDISPWLPALSGIPCICFLSRWHFYFVAAHKVLNFSAHIWQAYNIPGDPAYRLVYQKGTHVVSRGFLSLDIQVLLFDCLYLCYNIVYSS